MGMYDTIEVKCPHCGEIVEEQTKAFACMLDHFNLDGELPAEIAYHFNGEWDCPECDKKFYVNSHIPKMVRATITKKPMQEPNEET